MHLRHGLWCHALVLVAALLGGCGDNGGATPDADTSECGSAPDGTPCGDSTDSECNHADTCQAGVCVPNIVPDDTACGSGADSTCDAPDSCQAGVCQENLAPALTACGDPTDDDCNRADACDGAGQCVENLVAAGAACGDPTATDCDGADTCDGAGACADNLTPAATACGDPTATDCDGADTCDGAGACLDNLTPVATACGDATATDCDGADTCDGAGACLDNLAPIATACGDPTAADCNAADSCDGAGACLDNFTAAGTACGDGTDLDCDAADTCDGAGGCASNVAADGLACYDCAAGPGQCDFCAAGACDDGPACVEPGVPVTVATTFAAGNNHRGNMFDVTALNTITITSFDGHPVGDTAFEIYYRVGTHVGFETNAAGWTLIDTSPTVTAQPFGTATPIPIPINVTIPAGQTYAFYVTSTNTAVSLNYTDGTAVGNVFASDANLQVREGSGMEYPFAAGGGVFRPRVWNGVIHYALPTADATLGSIASSHSGNTSDGVMFDLVASADIQLRDQLELELAAGTHDVDVYFRRGSFVGFEGSVAGWERIATATALTSAGGGALSIVPLDDQIFMSAGETIGVYVDTGLGGAGLRTDPGAVVGDPAASTTELELQVGRSLGGAFGPAGTPAIVRGVFAYPVCVTTP